MKTNLSTKKIALAGVFTALAGVGSFISFPVSGSKCAPVHHMVNILAAVYLMRLTPARIFVYIVPFLISTVAGSILAFLLITVLEKGGVMRELSSAH